MTFLNLRILDEPGIQLESWPLGTSDGGPDDAVKRYWDLHNFADFVGLTYDAARAELTLEWIASPAASNPWGDDGNHHSGCALHFREVSALTVTPRDPEMPAAEDLTLEWCGMAERGASSVHTWEFPHAATSAAFRLAFQGGMTIEVVAVSVALLARGPRVAAHTSTPCKQDG